MKLNGLTDVRWNLARRLMALKALSHSISSLSTMIFTSLTSSAWRGERSTEKKQTPKAIRRSRRRRSPRKTSSCEHESVSQFDTYNSKKKVMEGESPEQFALRVKAFSWRFKTAASVEPIVCPCSCHSRSL